MLTNDPVTAMIPVTETERARKFYQNILGLRPTGEEGAGVVMFDCGGGSTLGIYQRPPSKADHTLACFTVTDLAATMKALRTKGIAFEEYDFPDLKTVNGVAEIDGYRSAWFKDPDGNILSVTQKP